MRLHGKRGMVYLDLTGGGVATPVAFLSDWNIGFTVTYADVTVITDPLRRSLALIPAASGDFQGFYDDASVQAYRAVKDGLPRSFILYPNTANMELSFSGLVLPQFAIGGSVGGAVSVQATWQATTPMVESGADSLYAATYAATY